MDDKFTTTEDESTEGRYENIVDVVNELVESLELTDTEVLETQEQVSILKEKIDTIPDNLPEILPEVSAIKERVSKLESIEIIQPKDGLDGKDGKNGINGIDGLDGINGVDGKDGIDGKDGSPDTAEQVRDKLETLKDEKRLSKEAIRGLEDFTTSKDLNRAIEILDKRTQYLINKSSTSSNGSVEIGDTVTGGTPDSILYIDNAGNLTEDAQFTRDHTTLETTIEREFDSTVLTFEIQTAKLMVVTNETGPFTVGETITGSTSLATATVDFYGTDGFLIVSNIVGAFDAGEVITGGTSLETADNGSDITDSFTVGNTFVVVDLDNTTFVGQGEILAIVAGGYSITMNSGTISANNGITVGNAPIAAGVLSVTPTAPIITPLVSGYYSADSVGGSGLGGTVLQQSSVSDGQSTIGVIDASAFGGSVVTAGILSNDDLGTTTNNLFVSPDAGAWLADNAVGDASIMVIRAGQWAVDTSLTGGQSFGIEIPGDSVRWIANSITFVLPDTLPSLGEVMTVGNVSGNTVDVIFDTPTSNSPANPDGAVQYNNGGAFGGTIGFVYDDLANTLHAVFADGLYLDPANSQWQFGDFNTAGAANYIRSVNGGGSNEFSYIGNVAGSSLNKLTITNGTGVDNLIEIGSGQVTGNGAYIQIYDSNGEINNWVDYFYRVTDLQTGNDWVKLDTASDFLALGLVNNTSIVVDNNNSQVTVESDNYFNYRNASGLWMQIDVIAGQERVRFGDLASSANATNMILDDFNQKFSVYLGGPSNELEIDFANATARFGGINTNQGSISFNDGTQTSIWAVQQGQADPTAITLSGTGSTGTITYNGAKIEPRIRDIVYNSMNGLNIGDYILRVTGGGTGAVSIDLSSQAFPVGHLLIIKDYDCIASTSNITLDAGTGNIISSTSQAQTFVMNTNGECIYIRAVGSGDWQIE